MMATNTSEPGAKRRKIRKGTRSCWECKGRKVKCTYTAPEDEICDGCFRRGTSCVSQALPEHPLGPVDRGRQMGNRIVRVEALIEKLAKKVGDGSLVPSISDSESTTNNFSPEAAIPTTPPLPHAANPTQIRRRETDTGAHSPTPNPSDGQTIKKSGALANEKISEALLAEYPPREYVNMVAKLVGPVPSFFHQLLVRKPYKDISIGEKEKQEHLAELTVRYTPQTHPLIIARQMLLLAISIRYLHPNSHHGFTGLSQPPEIVMQRVAHAAIELVATNDKMIDTAEGLECLLLASSFEADSCNLRSAWSLARRALLAAQLLYFHRQKRPPLKVVKPGNKWDPEFIWYRILFYDRFYSLILGLPQGSADRSMGRALALEDDTPMGRLERLHCVLASRILQRNEQDRELDDTIDTDGIDMELRKLSESMPSRWWLLPNLASAQNDAELFWETTRLTNQLLHYILLSHLHIPFILRSSTGPDQHLYEYNRFACINASRELLGRYRALRTFSHVSYCCHSMDFFALTASMTLVLAHLDARCSKRLSHYALVHQRISDRAIMEEILDNMEQVGTLSKTKTFSEKGAGVLRRLLAIEADAAQGSSYRLETGDGPSEDVCALRLSIPYIGVICITPDVQNSRAADEPARSGHRSEASILEAGPREVSSSNNLPRAAGLTMEPLNGPQFGIDAGAAPVLPQIGDQSTRHRGRGKVVSPPASEMRMAEIGDPFATYSEPVGSSVHQQSPPDSGLGVVAQEDWNFQGGGMNIFDAILKESDLLSQSDGDYWWLS